MAILRPRKPQGSKTAAKTKMIYTALHFAVQFAVFVNLKLTFDRSLSIGHVFVPIVLANLIDAFAMIPGAAGQVIHDEAVLWAASVMMFAAWAYQAHCIRLSIVLGSFACGLATHAACDAIVRLTFFDDTSILTTSAEVNANVWFVMSGCLFLACMCATTYGCRAREFIPIQAWCFAFVVWVFCAGVLDAFSHWPVEFTRRGLGLLLVPLQAIVFACVQEAKPDWFTRRSRAADRRANFSGTVKCTQSPDHSDEQTYEVGSLDDAETLFDADNTPAANEVQLEPTAPSTYGTASLTPALSNGRSAPPESKRSTVPKLAEPPTADGL